MQSIMARHYIWLQDESAIAIAFYRFDWSSARVEFIQALHGHTTFAATTPDSIRHRPLQAPSTAPAHQRPTCWTGSSSQPKPRRTPTQAHLVPRMLEPDCSWCSWWEVLTPSRRLRSARALPVFEVGAPITLSFSIWCWAICLGVAKTEKTETTPRARPMAAAVRKANPLLAWEMAPSAEAPL